MIRKVYNFLCSPPSKEVSLSIAFWSSFCVGLLINKTALSHAFKEGCQLSYQVNDPFFEESLRCSVHSDPWSCGAAEDRDPEGEVRASAAPESELSKFYTHLGTRTARSAQWLECQTCDWRFWVQVLAGMVGEFFPPGSTFCADRLSFRYLFHSHVTTVAGKRSWSFCQKCRGQVIAKHTYALCMWLCVKWHDMVHGCMVYKECANMAAVLSGTSHVRTKHAAIKPLGWIFKACC